MVFKFDMIVNALHLSLYYLILILMTLRKYFSDFEQNHLTLSKNTQIYTEEEFLAFWERNCRKLQEPFLKYCLIALCILLFLRMCIFEYTNMSRSYILPGTLVAIFWYAYEKNKVSTVLNYYLITLLVPLVVYVSAEK